MVSRTSCLGREIFAERTVRCNRTVFACNRTVFDGGWTFCVVKVFYRFGLNRFAAHVRRNALVDGRSGLADHTAGIGLDGIHADTGSVFTFGKYIGRLVTRTVTGVMREVRIVPAGEGVVGTVPRVVPTVPGIVPGRAIASPETEIGIVPGVVPAVMVVEAEGQTEIPMVVRTVVPGAVPSSVPGTVPAVVAPVRFLDVDVQGEVVDIFSHGYIVGRVRVKVEADLLVVFSQV